MSNHLKQRKLHMAIRDELIEELLKEHKNQQDLVGKDCIIKELTGRLIGHAVEGELTHQLGHSKHSPQGKNTGNSLRFIPWKERKQVADGFEHYL